MPTIVGIADTHMAHEQVKPIPGDILVVAGDFMGHGYVKELAVFNKWLGTLPHKHKIVVAGNHDWACQEEAAHLIKGIFTNAIYLNMEATTVMGIKFFGCPWTPEFFNWAFMYPRDGQKGKDIWAQVPDDTNVLVTHGPPAGMKLGMTKDRNMRLGEDAGCKLLTERILQLPNLKATFHGHIHPGAGQGVLQGRVTCHNVAVVDDHYQVVRHGLKYEYK